MNRQQQHPPTYVVVIGAGPAGLTAGYELITRGIPVVILEKDSDVGGLARTVEYKGFRFDIGGHRFFTKVGPVARVWRQMLGKDFLWRPRLSRIYWDVNADDEYHEEDAIEPERVKRPYAARLSGQTQPAVPRLL
jgi:protoporphyrinogen oxidase